MSMQNSRRAVRSHHLRAAVPRATSVPAAPLHFSDEKHLFFFLSAEKSEKYSLPMISLLCPDLFPYFFIARKHQEILLSASFQYPTSDVPGGLTEPDGQFLPSSQYRFRCNNLPHSALPSAYGLSRNCFVSLHYKDDRTSQHQSYKGHPPASGHGAILWLPARTRQIPGNISCYNHIKTVAFHIERLRAACFPHNTLCKLPCIALCFFQHISSCIINCGNLIPGFCKKNCKNSGPVPTSRILISCGFFSGN